MLMLHNSKLPKEQLYKKMIPTSTLLQLYNTFLLRYKKIGLDNFLDIKSCSGRG